MVSDERISFAEALNGRLAEYQEILALIDQSPGLTVLACDPFSGATALLQAAAEEAHRPCVLVDARGCADILDLACAIGDATVRTLAPDAAAWWMGTAPPSTLSGLKLWRSVSTQGIDLDELREGHGQPLARLRDATNLLAVLAAGPAAIIIDHFGPFLFSIGTSDARKLLGEIRALRQRVSHIDVMLTEYPDGVISQALFDPEHPLYKAGSVVPVTRAHPSRFVEDLAITRPATNVPPGVLRACAEMAAGVPALTWRAVDLSPSGIDPNAAAVTGWRSLRASTQPATARHYETLRRVHPLAQTLVAAIASGIRPHAVAANTKSVQDALRTMRALGLAWQPEPRRWALADPLLSAYAHDHAAPWIGRRTPEFTPMDGVDGRP